jgi:hypothetical protein
MNGSWIRWLLGGALLASLGWNAALLGGARGAGGAKGPCALDASEYAALGLDGVQQRELESLLRRCADESGRDDVRAAELSADLRRLLRDPRASTEEIRARARELGALRAEAVARCAESTLAMRGILGPEKAARVLESCCGPDCGVECGDGR